MLLKDKVKVSKVIGLVNVSVKKTFDETIGDNGGFYRIAPEIENNTLMNEVPMIGKTAEGTEVRFTVDAYSFNSVSTPKSIIRDGEYLLEGITELKKGEEVTVSEGVIWTPTVDTLLCGYGEFKG